MKIKIDAYRREDLPQMLTIWNEVVEDGMAFPQEKKETPASFADFLASQTYCGVARDETGGKILGMYILHPNNIGRCGHICNASYAVSKSCRGHGTGRLLVLDSLEMARKAGFGIMQFNAVTCDNEYANQLYKNLGFRQLGTIPRGFRRDNGYADINLYYMPLE